MPEGYDQLTKKFFHTERNVGLGLDMLTSPRDVPEGAATDTEAVHFSGGNIEPAKWLIGAVLAPVPPPKTVLHCVPFHTRTAKYLLLLTAEVVYVLAIDGCYMLPGKTLTSYYGHFVEPWFFDPDTVRWEGVMCMEGIEPVVVVNNNGLDAPAYWDGVTGYVTHCTTVEVLAEAGY